MVRNHLLLRRERQRRIGTALGLWAVLILWVAGISSAQAPAQLKLNPAASAEWLKIDEQQAKLVEAYNQLAEQKRVMLVSAGIPSDATARYEGGIVTFTFQAVPSPSSKP